MKIKYFGLVAVLGSVVALGANAGSRSSMYSSIDMQNSDGNTIRINRSASQSYDDYTQTRTVRRSYNNAGATQTRTYQRAEPAYVSKTTYKSGSTYKKSAMRKYFIANPFYQPLQGQFGSVTTGEYMQGTYKFASENVDVDRKLSEWSLKEDFSYGLTDRIALQAMAKYNWDKLTWKNSVGYNDTYKNDDLNLYGLGIQGRIVDTNEWISTLSGYYEHQKHGVDYFIADLKAGYKVATSTIYGLLRGWIVDMEGDIYGDYMTNKDLNEWGMLIYDDAGDTKFMAELGAGVWTVLAEDWTLNVEGLYGFYDWHNQLSIKGAFGWQPNDWFALNLYAKTSLYDSADGKKLHLLAGDLPLNQANWETAMNTPWDPLTGKGHEVVELSKFREWSIGLQVMFQF